MIIAAALLALQQGPGPAPVHPGEGSPTVDVPRIEAQIEVDGRLDEPAWEQAARLTGFWQYEPVDGRPAAEATEVLVWYSPTAIHFGIIAHDDDPGSVRATVADRDAIEGDDYITVYLDTFSDRRRAFFFAANPLGAQQDGVRTEGAASSGRLFGGNIDKSPDYEFDSEGRLTDSGYVIEMRIPFTSLRYPGADEQRWGIQVQRKVQRTGYTDTWTNARRGSSSFLGQSGTLVGLRDLERGVVWEAQPFVTAAVDGVRNDGGGFDRGDPDPEVGANFRVGFTGVSLDATINPDFSQVEADVGQVTVNERFALFYPEKRPFFLEGIELFSTPNQLVYTRRIANPEVGGKVTGKLGGIGIAHLTAVDDPVEGGDEALFNVTRLRRDFGASSTAGVTLTDRSVLGGAAYNRVLSGDVRYVFGGLYYLEGQLGGSATRDEAGSRSAPIWKAALDRTGRAWGFNFQVNAIGDDFVSRAGYVPRAGIVNGHAFNRLTLFGAEGAAIENLTVFFGPERIWRYGEIGLDRAIEGMEQARGMFSLRGGWRAGASVRRRFWVLDPLDYAGYELGDAGVSFAPVDEISGFSFEADASTPVYRHFDVSVGGGRGRIPIFVEGAPGYGTSLNARVALRPTESLRLALSNTAEWIYRQRDDSRFARTLIPRAQVEYQPTRAVFFRTIAEYRSEHRDALRDPRTGLPLLIAGSPADEERLDALRLDLLASYEPTPGTIAYLGYGSTLNAPDPFAFSSLERGVDGFFLKLAYRFRR